jgi:branched-chain amino acid transport system ATP-binding protein
MHGPNLSKGEVMGKAFLELSNVEVIYSDVILVLKGINMAVPEGQIVTLLGANGAGKSTTLKAISGLLRSEDGQVTSGTITFHGKEIQREQAQNIVSMGMVQVMEGHRLLQHMTVEQNLIVGGNKLKTRQELNAELEKIYSYFPILKEFRNRTSGYLSGGQQQMMVLGRGLMAKPKIVLLDEPSLGLAPLVAQEIFDIVQRMKEKEKVTFLVVEQNAKMALEIADYGYVLENGRIVLSATAEELRGNEDIKEFYLGMNLSGTAQNFSNVKHYKRRKRWLG